MLLPKGCKIKEALIHFFFSFFLTFFEWMNLIDSLSESSSEKFSSSDDIKCLD